MILSQKLRDEMLAKALDYSNQAEKIECFKAGFSSCVELMTEEIDRRIGFITNMVPRSNDHGKRMIGAHLVLSEIKQDLTGDDSDQTK